MCVAPDVIVLVRLVCACGACALAVDVGTCVCVLSFCLALVGSLELLGMCPLHALTCVRLV